MANPPQEAAKSRAQTRPNAQMSSAFGRLPDTVILRIAEFLPPPSKRTFSRCCRHFSSLLGAQFLNLSKARKPAWEILELGYPDHLECYYCRALHPIDKIHKYTPSEAAKNLFSDVCWKMDTKLRIARYIHPKFSFTVFRMIMKQYRQGKDCNKLLELLRYRSGPIMEETLVKQVVAEPKIVHGRLFMRSETAYVITPKESSLFRLLRRNLLKCPHICRYSHDNFDVTQRLFKRLAALETVSGGHPEHIMSCQCKLCPTEFRVSLELFEGEGLVLFITKWQDLGPGLSPLHSDLPSVVGPRRTIRSGEQQAYKSPRRSFEGLALGEGLQTASTLDSMERRQLFGKSNSTRVQCMRTKDSLRRSFVGIFGQYYPHEIPLKS